MVNNVIVNGVIVYGVSGKQLKSFKQKKSKMHKKVMFYFTFDGNKQQAGD